MRENVGPQRQRKWTMAKKTGAEKTNTKPDKLKDIR